ncbi:DNA sulfur modification protein DndD [Nocardia farcinica]|uniref:DNA sulfur modification protein DndD n=1 Tax=Nocardia farcinica TaxID=37329 RepID=UPI002453C64A|nr:DNA sulfur modification protein DndD [Nocardia farcinica]
MILNRLVLHNVGTFAGRHKIHLMPTSEDQPIVLIGGLNGAGKTTILESIQLALYGPLAHASGRRTGGYENYLRSLIHRGIPDTEGAAVELIFTAFQKGQEREYRIRRIWKSTGGASIREFLDVAVDGRHDRSLTATWAEHVETFLPRGIAGLFFFDGEQIEALADMERSQQVLRTALDALLGIDLVERLQTDLTVLRRRRRNDQVPEDLRKEIEVHQAAVTSLRKAETEAEDNRNACEEAFEQAQKQLHRATEAFRAAGGDLLERREAAESAAARLRTELRQIEGEIRRILGETAPLLQVQELLGQLVEQVKRETGAKRDKLLVEALVARDNELLGTLQKAKVRSDAIERVQAFLEADRSDRAASARIAFIAEVDDPTMAEALLRGLPGVKRQLESLVTRRCELKEELDQADRVVAAVPDAEAIAGLHAAREEARDAKERAEVEYRVSDELLRRTRSELAKAVAEYDSKVEKLARATLAVDDDRRLVDHVDRVRETLQRLRIAATRRHLERISQLILEALEVLLRKNQLVTDVRIDPETHAVHLTGADGRELAAKSMSAGERQLLAVALLWGLARAAGQPLPVVIDTPLGRLDGTHREHLLDRYFPQASHQVVLLSTDTEIDEAAYARIKPRVGVAYHLEFDTGSNATRVEHGYFWK